MAFHSRSGKAMLAQALAEAQNLAGNVKETAVRARDAMAAGPVSSILVLDLHADLKAGLDRLNALKATPGIGAYAQDQFSDPAYDIAAEFNGMTAAIAAVLTQIEGDFPADASGWLLERQFNAGQLQMRTFATAHTTDLRTALASLIATID